MKLLKRFLFVIIYGIYIITIFVAIFPALIIYVITGYNVLHKALDGNAEKSITNFLKL